MAATDSGVYDLLIVTDATASRGGFLASLNKDYDKHGKFTEWSGWHSRDAHQSEASQEALLSFVRDLRMHGGADWAEATKTGLALAYEHMRLEAKTVIFLYCDAPPHTEVDGGSWQREQDELTKPGAYGGNGKLFADWVSVADTLSRGDKKAHPTPADISKLDIPETWNVNCLSLLLEADQKFRLAVVEGHPGAGSKALLTEEDRELFDVLVSYKLLEMNVDMELMAEVGWTPEKNKAPLGPVMTCQICQFPRSVTVMADNHVCGPCAETHVWDSKEVKEAFIKGGVSAADTDTTLGTWTLTTAPCVECTKCKSRVIWPAAYRPSSFDPSTYQCPACTAGTPSTIVTAEATPCILASENGTAWLLRNEGATIREPLPIPHNLRRRRIPVHNAAALAATLRQWIAARRIQARACSLCFASAAHRDLRLACGGRKGCRERICGECARGTASPESPKDEGADGPVIKMCLAPGCGVATKVGGCHHVEGEDNEGSADDEESRPGRALVMTQGT
ncbi:uncharacterized protein P884DRAFT_299914 [Thermothelomyces heterothallicus CBS 202.75]|uniref:uncharacterized protein n=1 Tax=Thermothelomyces heterothallicus CBS 202.75 TaxID=1149848 RepID=UPI0037437A18